MEDISDDGSIADTELLLRRITPQWLVTNNTTGEKRLSSQAFQNYRERDAFSINFGSMHQSPQEVVNAFPDYGVVSFSAGEVRQLNQGVTPDALPDDASHGHVNGAKPKSVLKKLVSLAKWEVDTR